VQITQSMLGWQGCNPGILLPLLSCALTASAPGAQHVACGVALHAEREVQLIVDVGNLAES
jgi:hypothetical protein